MFVKNFLQAVSFLTIIPCPSHGRLAKSMIFFPLVGFLIGIFAYAVFLLAGKFFPESIACLALLIVPVILSGGLHADGFADFCDGFFGGHNREDVLRIMKDSRIGAFGALGLVFLFLAKYELVKVGATGQSPLLTIFPLALAAGRWMQVALSFYLPYAGLEGGLGASVASRVGKLELAGASVFLILFALLSGAAGLFSILWLLPLAVGLGFYFHKKIDGLTGDLLGAASEITELLVLFAGVGYLRGLR